MSRTAYALWDWCWKLVIRPTTVIWWTHFLEMLTHAQKKPLLPLLSGHSNSTWYSSLPLLTATYSELTVNSRSKLVKGEKTSKSGFPVLCFKQFHMSSILKPLTRISIMITNSPYVVSRYKITSHLHKPSTSKTHSRRSQSHKHSIQKTSTICRYLQRCKFESTHGNQHRARRSWLCVCSMSLPKCAPDAGFSTQYSTRTILTYTNSSTFCIKPPLYY